MDNHSHSTPSQSIPKIDMKINKYIAEFIGTFTLCFAGISAITITSGGNLVAIALAHGLALVTMVSAFGHISGGMFNPAVSVGVLLAGKMKPEEFENEMEIKIKYLFYNEYKEDDISFILFDMQYCSSKKCKLKIK